MANLGKWGALAGLGQGIAQAGQTMREQWIQAAQQKADLEKEGRASAEADRREKVRADNQATDALTRHNFNVDLEGVRHKNELELEKAKPARADLDKPEFWRADDVSYKEVNGQTFMLPSGGNQWQRVGNPGESMGPPVDLDSLGLDADKHADDRIKDQAGLFSTDKTDFAEYGGSRTKAKEAYRQEFIQGRTGQQPPSNQAPAAPAAGNQPSQNELPPVLRDTAASAKAAIERGMPRESVIQRLKASGATDDEIRMMGI